MLNNMVLSLMDLHHISQVARQIRHLSSHPDKALDLVLCPLATFENRYSLESLFFTIV
jgi:hypothetical protein